MIVSLLNLLILLVVCGILFWAAVWVLGLLGVTVPQRVLQLIAALVFLLVLLWFLTGNAVLIEFPTRS